MALTAAQLNTVYQNVLFRNADTAGIQFFANRTDISDAQVRQQIELSPEASIYVTPIVRLYQEVLGRVPDTAGLKYFSTQLRAGASTLESITQQFLTSSEFTSKTTATAGVVDATDVSNTNQLVADAFNSILGRQVTSGELAYFQGRTPAQILSGIAGSPEAQQANAANVTTFLDSAAQGTPNTGSLNNQTGAGGTGTGSTSNPGQQFTFTATVGETLTGTTGDDAFSGVLDTRGGTSTFNVGDSANGGAGNDTLNLTITKLGAAAAASVGFPAGATISGIETVNLTFATDGAGADFGGVNSSTFTGATLINQIDNSATARDFQAITVGTGVTAGFQSTGAQASAVSVGATGAGNAEVVTAASGTQTDISIKLAGVGGASFINVAGAGLTTETVTGSVTEATAGGADGAITLGGTAGITTLNLGLTSTNTNVTLGASYTGLTTINGASSTGGLTVNTTGLATLTSETYGSGVDKVTAGFHTAADTVNLGAGADTVNLLTTVTGTQGTLTVNLGAGSDTVSFAAGGTGNVTANTSTAAVTKNLITISDFSTTQDTLNLNTLNAGAALANQNTVNGAVVATNDLITNLKAVATATAAQAAAGTTQITSEFVYNGDLYVFNDTGTVGTVGAGDTLVKLTGVSALLTTGTNQVL